MCDNAVHEAESAMEIMSQQQQQQKGSSHRSASEKGSSVYDGGKAKISQLEMQP